MKLTESDVVRLKSGGPPMTIRVIEPGYPRVFTCQWFTGENKLETVNFPEWQLIKVEDQS